MRRLKTVLWLECYALVLAVVQEFNGVRTDEAKYLLDIPYPHPPLARWLFSLLDGFAWQEFFVRAFMATLMVQAVWIAWDMARSLRTSGKIAVAVLWLCSAAFVLQAGTVMMAPLTALQALVFLWMLSLPRERLPGMPAMGFLWLATLFTALQGVLLAPLVFAALRLRGASWQRVALYLVVPLALVGLYALGNPLVAASVLLQSGKDAGQSFADRALGLGWILVLAGSGVGTLIGIVGLVRKRHPWILFSFVLIATYVFLGRHEYYAVLFLPFFVTGTKHLLRPYPRVAVPMAVGLVACTVAVLARVPLVTRHPAEAAFAFILEKVPPGITVLRGDFGHEWQYEFTSGHRVMRDTGTLPAGVTSYVCADGCDRPDGSGWMLEEAGSYRVWAKPF